jgi:chromosome segregation ATPase
VATLTRDGEAARKNFATVQSVAAAQAGESTGQLTELRLELQQAKKELAEKNAALSRQLAEGTDAAKQLAAVNGQLDDTHKELTALKSSQAELNESVRRLTEERGRLQAQGIATDAGKAEIARLQDQVATLTRKGEAARKDLAAAQTAAASQVGENTSQLAGLRLELQQAKKDLAESRTQNQSLQEASQRLEHQGKATTDAAVRLAEAQSDIEQLKRENASLQAERNALTARLAQSAPAVAATAAATVASADSGSGEEVARLKEELAREQSKVEMTVRSFALAQQENERLKAQIDQGGVSAGQARDTGATLAGAQRDLATVRADASKAAAETAALRDLLRQVQNSNAGFAAENARLRAALAMAGGALPAGLASHPVRPAMAAASVATPPAAQVNAAPAPRTHKVVSGDTLSQISSRYYGTPSRWQDIYNANRDKLRNPDVLPLDVELKVP